MAFLPLLSAAQDSNEQLWQRATEAYAEGNYAEATSLYNSIVESGSESSTLYFNLGNSYYKQDSIAKAIAFYLKAQKMAPADERIAHNLELAQAQTKNRIDALPEFFIITWFKSIKESMTSNSWAVVAIICFALSLLSVMLYLLTSKVALRKVGFSGAVIAIVLFLVSLNYSIAQKEYMSSSGDAVIIRSAVAVKGSPDNSGKELFILNEGATVNVIGSIGNWREIVVASGNSGWVKSNSILEID